MVESSDKTWPTGEGNGKPLHYSCLENPSNNMKTQKDRALKDSLPGLVGDHYAPGNNSPKTDEMEPSKNNIQLWM